jgi:hypothetical protein
VASHLQPPQLRKLRQKTEQLEKEASALYLDPEGARYRLVHLNDVEFMELRRLSLAIQEDSRFMLDFLLSWSCRNGALTVGKVYAALCHLTGPTGKSFDNYKGSFSFPFSLDVLQEGRSLPYLFEVRDFRGGLEFPIRKVVEVEDPRLREHRYHVPFADELSNEAINCLVAYWCAYVKGYWSRVKPFWQEPFVLAVESNHVLFGFAEGRFFEEQYESEDSFSSTCGRYQETVRRERDALAARKPQTGPGSGPHRFPRQVQFLETDRAKGV